MKRTSLISLAIICVAAFCAKAQNTLSAPDPDGSVSYSLPMTSLTLEIEAVQEIFYAGPYAKFAQKYLGIEVRQKDEASFQITSVKMTPCIEADQSRRFTANIGKSQVAGTFMRMCSQGLVSIKDSKAADESVWKFTARTNGDFSDKGVSSNFTSESTTLYQGVKDESAYNKVPVQQSMVVEKSLEKKAQEAAEMILSLRKTRVQIVTGDTDANYSGQAMAAALEEIGKMEKEYMILFTGYSETQTQSRKFDVIPVNDGRESKVFVAFRLSDTEGLLPADNLSGKPYVLDFEPEEIAASEVAKKEPKPGSVIWYRIPAICTVKLTDGSNTLLQSRVPIYQFGVDKTITIK